VTTADGIRRRLGQRADVLGIDLQAVVLYYAVERFLYRLSMSRWADRLVVKGATMLRVWDAAIARPTRDIDFLGRIPNTPEAVREIVAECLGVPVDDGLTFSDAIEAIPITVENRYPGVRVKVAGSLAGVRFVLRLGVGVDDAVVPEPGWVDYPTLLGDPAPRILAYHPSTAIAEKVQAMVEIGMSNSRLKDYYDVWMLSRGLGFGGQELVDALSATFAKRDTRLPAGVPPELTAEFTAQRATSRMWASYRSTLSTAGIDAPEDLAELAAQIAEFIAQPLEAAAAKAEFDRTWTPGRGWHC
jgi:hypothetical protein